MLETKNTVAEVKNVLDVLIIRLNMAEKKNYEFHISIETSKTEKSRKKETCNNDWKFLQINVRYQTTDLGSSENTKQDKCPKTAPRQIIFKVRKI